jgi:hypothetical protein
MSTQTDVGLLLAALAESREILGRYIEPGPRNPGVTVEALLDVWDDTDVVAALDRVAKRRSLRLVEID